MGGKKKKRENTAFMSDSVCSNGLCAEVVSGVDWESTVLEGEMGSDV